MGFRRQGAWVFLTRSLHPKWKPSGHRTLFEHHDRFDEAEALMNRHTPAEKTGRAWNGTPRAALLHLHAALRSLGERRLRLQGGSA